MPFRILASLLMLEGVLIARVLSTPPQPKPQTTEVCNNEYELDAQFGKATLAVRQAEEKKAVDCWTKKAKAGEKNLVKAYLIKADLTGAALGGANLSQSRMEGANLTKASLLRANLTEAGLTGANLTGARLWGADLTKAILEETNLTGTDFKDAKMIEAHLNGATLSGTIFVNTDLTKADFHKQKDGDYTDPTKIVPIDLTNVRLNMTNFTGANLRGAIFKPYFPPGGSLKGVNLEGARLSGVSLSGMDLTGHCA